MSLSLLPRQCRFTNSRLTLLLILSVSLAAALPLLVRAALQSSTPPPSERKQKRAEFIPGEILVRFRKDAAATKSRRVEMSLVEVGRQIPLQVERLDGPEIVEGLRLARVAPEDTMQAIEALRFRPDVLYAEPNYIRRKDTVPNDPRYSEQWALKNTGQSGGTAGADIKAEQAWDITTGSRHIVVGVVDEGIDINHPDLKDNIWKNPGEIPDNGVDDDGNGYADDVNGWDFLHNDKTVFDGNGTYPADQTDAHGTHVAGTIGATGNNGVGVVGVNWQVSLMSLKFLGVDGGSTAKLLQAFGYAKMMRDLWSSSGGAKGANLQVLNNSYGGPGFSQAELDAIRALGDSGILFVVAAGNAGRNNDLVPVYPSNYVSPNVISVAASTSADSRTSFTNIGPTTVHIGAPGQGIVSTTPAATYSSFSGTSMAAPHVSGVAALVLAASPNAPLVRLRAALLYSGYIAPWQNFFPAPTSTGRSLDADAAVKNIALNDSTPPAAVGQFKITNSNFPTCSLEWLATGDDSNSGKAAAYEIRFSDTDLSSPANFELAQPLPAPQPGDPFSLQQVDERIPYRHPSGFIGIRAIDKVGNAGPISSVQFSASPNTVDPYVVSENSPNQLSTGGTALGVVGDDVSIGYTLPFPFPFFGRDAITGITVSSNGTLYFGSGPGGFDRTIDPVSSVGLLNSYSMVAGIWDDLRTDRQAGDDVYVVIPDAYTVIFRWQAVTYDTLIAPGMSRGENPVNFEIELRSDGTIIIRYGDGNQKLLPVVGVSGGAPDSYVVDSHTSKGVLTSLKNASTVFFAPRNPQPPPTADLMVSISSSPDPVSTGNQIAYSMYVANRGFSIAPFVIVADQLPQGTTFVSCSTNWGACSGPQVGTNGVVKINIPAFSDSLPANISIVVQVNAAPGTTLSNTVTVASGWVDRNPGDNSSTVTNDVVPHVLFGDAKAVAAGINHTLALKTDGTVWAWGSCQSGALGDGTFYGNVFYPSQVLGLLDVIAISAGNNFSLALKSDGTVWAWGHNYYGQLGIGVDPNDGPQDQGIPVQVHGLTNVRNISTGFEHSLAVKNDGTAWAWGYNGAGQLGDSTQINRSEPVQVSGLNNVVSISGGTYHSVAARADGTVWGWGWNSDGQATAGAQGQYVLTPIQVSGVSNVLSVSGSTDHSLALKNNGEVWAWGDNHRGQLGSNNTLSHGPLRVPALNSIVAIEGRVYSLALKSDGTVWIWENHDGPPDDPTADYTPVQVSGLSGVLAISSGAGFSAALLPDRTVWMWGANSEGQLGNGTTFRTSAPAPVSGLAIVTTPTFGLPSATYAGPQTLVIYCITHGATIHYTTNDRDPTENDPVIVSGSSITIDHTVTLKARAWKPGWSFSNIRTATFTIVNWIDDARNFVRQQYLDFLSREPDQGGWDYWTNQINSCGSDQLCIRARRIAVSDAFFFEPEFQQTGSYVFRLYRAAYGDNQPFPNPDPDPRVPGLNLTIPNYAVFNQDRAQVVGGAGLAQSQLDLANAFVQRPEFLSKYPASLSAQEFINAVLATIQSADPGVDLSSEQSGLMNVYNQGGRGAVIYRLADDNVQTNTINNRGFIDAEYNRTFVTVEYFGYLRRDADTFGLNFWLGQLNRFPLRDINIQHAMVCSFITSIEYQKRFGSTVTHTNAECPQ